jgi:PhnB protein
MQVQPYLNFDGGCEEALQFYKSALGAEVTALMRCKDAPDSGMIKPGLEDKVLHSSFRVGDSTIMASDGYCQGKPEFRGVSLTIIVPEEADAKRLFAALSEGGEVRMPLAKTFFSPLFGMVADRFGVSWMIIVR